VTVTTRLREVADSEIAPGSPAVPCAVTVPAAFGRPGPFGQGVATTCHRWVPREDGAVSTLLRFNCAWISFAPKVAPPAATGMCGDGRQTWRTYDAAAAIGPEAGSITIGTRSSWPAAWRTSTQYPAWVAVPVHCATAAPTVAWSVTTTVPVNGRTAPAIGSRTRTCAATVPSWVPDACPSVAVYPVGT
jgi:hypothetical protein